MVRQALNAGLRANSTLYRVIRRSYPCAQRHLHGVRQTQPLIAPRIDHHANRKSHRAKNALDIITALVFNARLACGGPVLFGTAARANQESEVIATCMRTALSVDRGQEIGGEGTLRAANCEFAVVSSLRPATRLENPSRDALS